MTVQEDGERVEQDNPRDLMLVVNVRNRWREVLRGEATDQQVVLGDWNLDARDIEPTRVAVVIGVSRGVIVRAWPVHNPQPAAGYDHPRIRFTPAGQRLGHLEGQPSPYAWRRGEMYPVVALPLTDMPEINSADQVTLGGYTLTVTSSGATVSVPPGGQVIVKPLPAVGDL